MPSDEIVTSKFDAGQWQYWQFAARPMMRRQLRVACTRKYNLVYPIRILHGPYTQGPDLHCDMLHRSLQA